nr:RNA-dependent RNA polymerase [Picobirnavirus sp.]AVD97023.1 RNA-dependent RNA polymerase [Picobirnavirus sp.]
MSKGAIRFGDYFKLPNPGLRAYFSQVEAGQPDEYRTSFYRDRSVQSILNGWSRTLATISKEWPTLFEFENDLRKKVGPMSVMKPLSQRLDDIDSYYDSISLESKPILKEALDAVIQEWKPVHGLALRSEERTAELMKKSTNSGSPYFTKRSRVLSKTIPCSVDIQGEDVTQRLKSDAWNSAAILGWRGQEGGPNKDDVKQRVVWMFPFAVNVKELQVYQPAIESAQRFNLVPAWVSMEAVDNRITNMFDSKGRSDLVICTDFSKFDQHFNADMQSAARYMLQNILSRSPSSVEWLERVFPIKYMIPLAYDWGKIRKGAHGMGSGSGGTNFDETLTHRALQYEAAFLAGSKLNPYSQCLGDDGVLTFPGCTAELVMQAYSSHGQDMNLDKQYVSKHDCTYLRRWHQDDYRMDGVCVGVYSTYRALGRLCEQERYYDPEIWGPKMVALRQLSIIENVKYHPLRKEFLSYCIKGDRYRLGLDIPGFLTNIESEAQKAIDEMPDFLGYTKSQQKNASAGISEWWVVKELRSLK